MQVRGDAATFDKLGPLRLHPLVVEPEAAALARHRPVVDYRQVVHPILGPDLHQLPQSLIRGQKVGLAQMAERLVGKDPGEQRVDDDVVLTGRHRLGFQEVERDLGDTLDQRLAVRERRKTLRLPERIRVVLHVHPVARHRAAHEAGVDHLLRDETVLGRQERGLTERVAVYRQSRRDTGGLEQDVVVVPDECVLLGQRDLTRVVSLRHGHAVGERRHFAERLRPGRHRLDRGGHVVSQSLQLVVDLIEARRAPVALVEDADAPAPLERPAELIQVAAAVDNAGVLRLLNPDVGVLARHSAQHVRKKRLQVVHLWP